MFMRIKLFFAAGAVLIAAFVAAYFKGRRDSAMVSENQHLKSEIDAHERINDADTGGGATDGERIKRLREMAAKLGH
jgi:hypothetical protein